MPKPRFQKYILLFIPVLFLMYSAPSAIDYVFHYPDEKYYTDAVLQMLEKGDNFTPYQANGEPRFKKPILTYWLLIASYKVLGVSRFSSRVLFWLAGALLVLITYLMGKSLSGNKKTAAVAAFITASNPIVLLSASRSIPDIFLVLFLTISAWGFLEILLAETIKKRFYWMAYLGAALAFETKGLPAAAFAGASMLYLLLNPWRKIPIKKLFESFSLIVSIVVALSWFIIMYVKHGAIYLDSFFADQVGDRVSSKLAQVVNNTFLGIINLVVFSVPWIIIIFVHPKRLKKQISNFGNRTKSIVGFIIVWLILVVVMSGLVFRFYDRYILPVIPLLALFFAFVLEKSSVKAKNISKKIFLIINIFLFFIISYYAVFIQIEWALIFGILLNVVLLLFLFSGKTKTISVEIIISNLFLLFFFNSFILLYPLLMPNPGKQLVQVLNTQKVTASEKIYVYGNIRAASNIRIHCNNQFNVVSMDTVFALPAESNHFLVFNEKEKEKLDLTNYKVIKGSEEWSKVPIERFPLFLQHAIFQLKANGTKYLIAKPK